MVIAEAINKVINKEEELQPAEVIEEENDIINLIKKEDFISSIDEEDSSNLEEDLEDSSDLEDSLEDEEGDDEEDLPLRGNLTIRYSFEEEQLLAEKFYQSTVTYQPLLYENKTTTATSGLEAEYSAGAELSDLDSDILSVPEAEEAFMEIQLAAAIGTQSEINVDLKRKFDLWIKLHPAEFKLFESLYSFTSDVNYAEF